MSSVVIPTPEARNDVETPSRRRGRVPTESAPEPPSGKPEGKAKDAAPATIPDNARKAIKDDHSFMAVSITTTVAVLVAFAIGRSGLFTPGDDVGYYVGMAGGIMMLLLLAYPLRKHVAALRNWGKVKHWFAVHMVLGISGPVLVLAHSTFHMRSTNAAVALVCMLVVAGSGIVGRFLYTKVHRGLYGEKLNLQELQKEAGLESEEVESRFAFVPKVEKRLVDYRELALAKRNGLISETVRFTTLTLRRRAIYHACVSDLRLALAEVAKARNWDPPKLRRRLTAAATLVRTYLIATQRVAEFAVYDRLLQLWHVAHVPLVYLLVISAIAHVVAVHMY
jgi:hypothetical protein